MVSERLHADSLAGGLVRILAGHAADPTADPTADGGPAAQQSWPGTPESRRDLQAAIELALRAAMSEREWSGPPRHPGAAVPGPSPDTAGSRSTRMATDALWRPDFPPVPRCNGDPRCADASALRSDGPVSNSG